MFEIVRQVRQYLRRLDLIPSSLFRPGFLVPDPPRFLVKELPLSDASVRDLANLAKKHARIDVLLDRNLGLHRVISLPRAALAKANAAIGVQMRQTLPEMAKGLVWQTEETGRTAAEVTFTVHVFREAMIEQLARYICNAGSTLREVRFHGVLGTPLNGTDSQAEKKQRVWAAATVVGVVAILLWRVWSIEADVNLLQLSNVTRANTNAQLEERLVSRTERVNDVEGAKADLLADLGTFEQRAVRLPFWTDLTRDLPDSVWVSEFSVNGDSLSLSGFTQGDATEVIEALQSLDWTESVRLEGPTQFDSYSRQNRFGLVATLTEYATAP